MGFTLLSEGFLHTEPGVDGGNDIRMLLKGGEQLLLEYLSHRWVEFTLFLLNLPVPGECVEGQTFRLRTTYPEFIRTKTIIFILMQFHPNSFLYSLLEIICCIFLFGNAQWNSSTDPNLHVRG